MVNGILLANVPQYRFVPKKLMTSFGFKLGRSRWNISTLTTEQPQPFTDSWIATKIINGGPEVQS